MAEALEGPSSPVRPTQLRFTPSSLVRAVVVVGVAVALVGALGAAGRPLGWVAVAVILAALLHPLVVLADRVMPRPLAVTVVALGALAVIGGLAYAGVDDVGDQLDRLERAAPAAAAEIEASDRFGELATELELTARVESFVDELPDRLRGGDEVAAIRSAASRGVAYLITFVLTVFFLVSGPTYARRGLAQITDPDRREGLTELLDGAYQRFWQYAGLTLGRCLLVGVFTWLVALAADLPGPVLLGVWVAVWALVPLVGIAVGALAPALVAVPQSGSLAVALLVLFVGYQVADGLLLQRRIDHATLHVGPFVTLVAGLVGLEAYGVGGMLASVTLAVFVVSLLRGIRPGPKGGLLTATRRSLGEPSS